MAIMILEQPQPMATMNLEQPNPMATINLYHLILWL